ncbi:MAG: hypothetical protein Q4B26_14810 [Eubacteriales bacterium]|nr:hypothetical protein [Eubacteriales bacterium]
MRKYELSISADYVPAWGVVEATREFFQNALDEETRDASNKMMLEYDPEKELLKIGNKHSKLDIKTLLFGNTTKADNDEMIGNHGEGYKIATVVLLRNGKTVTFQNYCRHEVWRPRLVRSRKYDGMMVPTFFVENNAIWMKAPEHSLIIEIGGITAEEYEKIQAANLHLQEYEKSETRYGDILEDKRFVGKVFVGGLYICEEPRLDNFGLDFKPSWVRLERDRSMVNSFDVQWYAARMIEESADSDLIKSSIDHYSGTYVNEWSIPDELKDEIAEDFINRYGAKAVPVTNQSDLEKMKKRGWKPVIVTEAKKKIILASKYFADVQEEYRKLRESEKPLADRFCSFIEKIEEKLSEEETRQLYEFLDEIQEGSEGE